MAGRRISDEQDARRCLTAARSMKGGLAEWARANGVDGRSLNLWRLNLERRGVRPLAVAPRLIELVPTVLPAPSLGRYVLHVGGVGLAFGDDFNETSLRRLVGLLKSC